MRPQFKSEDQQSAIANLAMLREIAAGRTKAKPEDIETRFKSVLSYLMTEKCVGDDYTKKIIAQLSGDLRPMAQAAVA